MGLSFRAGWCALLLLSVLALAALPAIAAAEPVSETPSSACVNGTPSVATDKATYLNYETVHITGEGYTPGCVVTVEVARPDGSIVKGDGSETPGSDSVTASEAGAIAYDYKLGNMDGVYVVTVRDGQGTALASTTFYDAPELKTLHETNASGTVTYMFAPGASVYADGTVDNNKHWRFVVKDPGGVERRASTCSGPSPNASHPVSDTYTIPSTADATSGAAGWRYELRQFPTGEDCAARTNMSTAHLEFRVVRVSVYANAALSDARSAFKAGERAYAVVHGVSPDQADWSVTWRLPSNAAACANTAGTDRPDPSTAGRLPGTANSSLHYPPSSGAADAWNDPASYDGSCPAFSSQNQGQWRVTVAGKDKEVNGKNNDVRNTSATLPVFTVDTSGPGVPTIERKPADPTSSTSAAFEFTPAESGGTVQCRLDGGEWATCSSRTAQSYSSLADGSHTFRVRQLDAAGNEGQAASYTWTVDTTGPGVPTIERKPADPTSSTSAAFEFTPAESGGTVQCRLDGGEWATCSSRTAQSYSSLADGSHTFRVRQLDAAGNEGQAASYTWTVDTTGPGVPTIERKPADPTSSTSAAFEFTPAESGGTVQCRLDGGEWATCSSRTAQSYSSLADGSHTFRVRQLDAAGNEGQAASYTWTVDTTGPGVPTIERKPADPTSSTSAAFEFTPAESGGTVQCRLDGGEWATCSSRTAQSYSSLADGEHTFRVRQLDAAGNEGQAASYTWTVDTTGPGAPTIERKPADPTSSTSAAFEFTPAESGGTVQCRLDGGEWATCSSRTAQSYSSLADGSHTFRVRQLDAAGNEGQAASYTWTVDTTGPGAPTIERKPADPTSSTSAAFEFTPAESGGTVQCKLDGGEWATCSSRTAQSYSSLADGSHTFRVRQLDAAGNEGQAASYTWTVDTGAPTTRDDVPSTPADGPHRVTLTWTDDGSGVDRTHYTTDGTEPTASSRRYDPDDKPVLNRGERIRYFSVDRAGNRESVRSSVALQVREESSSTGGGGSTGAGGGDATPVEGQAESRPGAPVIARLTVTPACTQDARLGGGTASGRRELMLGFTLSQPASVHMSIERRDPSMTRRDCRKVRLGRNAGEYRPIAQDRVDGRTGDNSASLGSARAAAAARRRVGRLALRHAGEQGRNQVRIASALGGRRLARGTYRVLVYAENSAGERSALAKAIFRVVR